MNSKLMLLAIFICAVLQPAFAQTPAAVEKTSTSRDGTITGRVTSDGQPLRDVQVAAIAVNAKVGGLIPTTCDEEGNFKLTGLRPGAYRLLAIMPGYVSRQASDAELYRAGDQVIINMVKGGVITGRVTDAAGDPMPAVRVTPVLIRDLTGKRANSFSSLENLGQSGRLTDDRGIYRLFGLHPGVYIVSVNGSANDLTDMSETPAFESPTYHLSATRDTATEISVGEGAEVTGVDIRHRGERGRTVSGTLSGETTGDALINAVSILLKSATTGQIEAMAVTIGSSGFALYGVPNGEYDLVAVRFNESNDQATSMPRRISVRGADISGIELKLLKLGSIAGKVVIEKADPAKACQVKETYTVQEISLSANRENQKGGEQNSSLNIFDLAGGLPRSAPAEKGEFTLKNLDAGSYRLSADLPGETWYVRGITQPGIGAAKRTDAARLPFGLKQGEKLSGLEITIAEGAASLSGRVIAAKEGQTLTPRLIVHLIPAEVTAADEVLRYREAESGQSDSFEFKHLAPGKYWLLARPASDGEASSMKTAFDPIQRAKLRREAEAAKNEIELKPCARVKDSMLRF